MAVQDDLRERILADLFNLTRQESRIGIDALDENDNMYELKSTTRSQVSTARDLGPNHIKKWKQRYWIVANGVQDLGKFEINSVYFLSSCHMAEWYHSIEERFRKSIEINKMVMTALRNDPYFPHEHHETVEYVLGRGMLLNDPGIPWKYIVSNGILIEDDHAKQLRFLVSQYPIDQEYVHDPFGGCGLFY